MCLNLKIRGQMGLELEISFSFDLQIPPLCEKLNSIKEFRFSFVLIYIANLP